MYFKLCRRYMQYMFVLFCTGNQRTAKLFFLFSLSFLFNLTDAHQRNNGNEPVSLKDWKKQPEAKGLQNFAVQIWVLTINRHSFKRNIQENFDRQSSLNSNQSGSNKRSQISEGKPFSGTIPQLGRRHLLEGFKKSKSIDYWTPIGEEGIPPLLIRTRSRTFTLKSVKSGIIGSGRTRRISRAEKRRGHPAPSHQKPLARGKWEGWIWGVEKATDNCSNS